MVTLYDVITDIIGTPITDEQTAIVYACCSFIVLGVAVSIFGIIRSLFK